MKPLPEPRFWMVLLLWFVSATALADTTVTTQTLRLTFSEQGNLQSAIACFPACSGDAVRLQQFADDGVITFETASGGQWSVSDHRAAKYQELAFVGPGGARLTWRIPVQGYRIELDQAGVDSVSVRSGQSFRPREAAGFGNWLEQSRYVLLQEAGVRQIGLDEDVDEDEDEGGVGGAAVVAEVDGWLGYRNRYWALMAFPPEPVGAQLASADARQDAEITVGSVPAGTWSFYLGPIEPRVLKSADSELPRLMYAGLWFWLRWICLGLFHLLAGIKLLIPSWGIAIMLMSLTVNILMLPLSRIADRFQQQVNETEARLAPELHRIKKNFKGEEQAAKILALYKTERVHPLYSLKSLMGVAVVIPVFIGAFDMLAENIHLLNTGFLWIADLSHPDDLFHLPFRLPFFGSEFNLLPFLMTGLSFIASMLHKPLALDAALRGKQVRNMLLLAVAFFVLFYTFPAGMVLYWTTNNLISVIKSLWARR
ncbi:MAG: membrane protein insertase YidC [Xanthomonadales bacterium]|jgi:YidC/Oxa1 family membrane protein insertase|nr:membrane protein insertase YidC [Xanthomonadales bacterium]